MPTIGENKRLWNDEYKWDEAGNDWPHQAVFCGQPYEGWKTALADNYLYKNLKKDSVVLEIAPGHGRWTGYIFNKAAHVTLVDLSPRCIEYCKEKFADRKNAAYYVNDGKSLDFLEDGSIDLIWSYDSFVHMEKDVIESYFKEFSRVLNKGGKAIIHHAGRRHFALRLCFLRRLGRIGRDVYRVISLRTNTTDGDDGWRSCVSKELIKSIAEQNGLLVVSQTNTWGRDSEYNCKLVNDYISEIVKE